jgi:hypothetical protein
VKHPDIPKLRFFFFFFSGATGSTSNAKTAGGNRGAGKLQKIRADIYFFFLLSTVKRKIIIFTEQDMVQLCESEKSRGRIPKDIEIYLVELPNHLRLKLHSAKKKCI